MCETQHWNVTISIRVIPNRSGRDCYLRCTMPLRQRAHCASAMRFNVEGPDGQKFDSDAIEKWCAENMK